MLAQRISTMKKRILIVFVTIFGLVAGSICQAEIKAAFYTPNKFTEDVEEKISASLKKDRDITIEKITKITPDILKNYKVLILWGTRINFKKRKPSNSLDNKQTKIVRTWVENGGGLLCFHDAVGLEKHDSRSVFPEAGEGIDNYYPDRKPYVREGIVSRSHPVVKGIPEGSRFVVSYFDFITIKPGVKGVPVIRRVNKSPVGGGVVDDPLLLAAEIEKGRYVACGFATGLHASNTFVEPKGTELLILKNSIAWLAASGDTKKYSDETAVKGKILKVRNLLANPSCEKVKYAYPVGWKKALSSGKFEWGVSEEEKHSGRYSAFVKVKGYYTDKNGTKFLGGGVATGMVSANIKPNTEYKFSFWMKTTSPYVRVWSSQLSANKKKNRYAVPTSADWLKPVDSKWHKYSGKFITSSEINAISLSFYITGRKEKWGRNSGIPLGSIMYIDDVALNESASVSSTSELREKNFVRMKNAKWKASGGKIPKLMQIAAETPLEFNKEYLKFPAFNNSPGGGKRIDLNGLWKIKKFYGLKNAAKEKSTGKYRLKDADTDDPGLKSGFWRKDFNDGNWAKRYVPSNWLSEDTPRKSKSFGTSRRPRLSSGKPAPWIGWYRREFKLGDIGEGRRVILNFERVSYKCEVWVNGKKVGKHIGGLTPFKFDISEAVKAGKTNVLAVRVFDPIKVYDWGHWVAGGIWDIVYIDTVPVIYSRRNLITPNLKKSLLGVEAWINNTTGRKRSVSLTALVKSYPTPYSKGPEYSKTSKLGKFSLKPGMNKINLKIPMVKPVYWSPKNPFLYTLELKIKNDFISKDRFGFRSFTAKGSDFILNGKPLFLRGECLKSLRLQPNLINPKDRDFVFMKKYLMAHKILNINNVYPMITPLPKSILNLLDEIGITLYADWHAAQGCWPMNDAIQSEKGLKEMEAWVYDTYNHPSSAMWSLGGELYEHYTPKFVKNYDQFLNPLYDMIKKLDKQNRPICQSSGRIPKKGSKTDIWDDHAYPGAIAGSWTEEDDIIDMNISQMRKLYGKKRIPFIQYEVGGFDRRYNVDWKACKKAGFKADNDWDKEAFIRISEAPPTWRYGLRQTSGIYGTRRWLKDVEEFGRTGVGGQKLLIKGVLGMSRTSGLMAGIGVNADPFALIEVLDEGTHLTNIRSFFRNHYSKGDLSKKIFVASEAFGDLKRIYNPALICWTLFPKNNFAGKKFSVTTYVVNDTGRKLKNLSARVLIKDKSEQIISDTIAKIDDVPYYKRLTFPYTVKLPKTLKTGDYKAELFLYEKDKIISDAYYELYILGGGDWQTPITTTKKVAVFDKGAKIIGKEGQSTSSVLKDLKVPFTEINDFKRLNQYDVLIIGAYSMSPLMTGRKEIVKWLNNGGRLLAFEQMTSGPIPFLPQLRIISGAPNISGDIVTITHPAFKDLSCYNFFRWNGNAPGVNNCPGAIFTKAIKPVNKTMVMVGATAVPRTSLKALSMLLSDVKVGKGMAVFNQLEATSRYGSDSAATQYARNLIKYVLSNETKYSTPLDSYSLGKVNLYECGLVDLGKGQRLKTNGLCFNVPDKEISIGKGKTVAFDLTKNQFYDPKYEAKYDAEHVDEGGLQHNFMEKIFFLYSCDSIQPGKNAVALTIKYANGGKRKILLTGGVNISGANAKQDCPMAVNIGNGLFITSWLNPYPKAKIKSLEIVGLNATGFKLKGVTCKLIRGRTHR